ncbi:PKD domain-containing protein [Halobacterium salinarum]|uniref:PKD domain-containing protein n=1 Tax=Halobacterium salinarum TaxID=2242 RepID=UPI0025547785|nr:PKD domain-containing protein [Halobacterium salinarum]MDL0125590.1 PKD domain-containing protein [Halobacterium salinarum]
MEGTSQHGHDDSENLTDVVEIDEQLTVTDLRMTNVSGNLSITFNASKALTSAPVEIRGAANHTLAIDAFSETTTNGAYRYETQYQPPGDGEYTAELDTASGVDGDPWSGALTANETIDTRTPGVNVTLRDQTDGNGIVNATDQVRIIANVSGSATRAAFDRITFSNGTPTLAHIGGNTFATNATVGNLTSGPYNVRVRAFGTSGHEASATSNTVLVDTDPPVANITVEDTITRGASTRLAALTTTDDETQIVDAAWQVDGETIAGNTSLLERQATAPLRLYSGTTARVQKTTTTTTNVQNVTYTFDETGTHTVALTVVDAAGNTNTDTTSVTVTEQSTQQPPATPDDDDDDDDEDSTPTTTASSTTATPTTTAATSTTRTTTQSPSNTTTAPRTPTQTSTTADRTRSTDTNSSPSIDILLRLKAEESRAVGVSGSQPWMPPLYGSPHLTQSSWSVAG